MTVLGDLLAKRGPRVLQNCRLEGLGGALYGREAIEDALAALSVGASRLELETPLSGIWLDDGTAIFADLVDGHVQRLWVMSDRTILTPAPAIDVPTDPDLQQAVWGVRFDPRDHPALELRHADPLRETVLAWPVRGMARIRPVILRAASVGGVAFALVRLGAEACDRPGIPQVLNGALILDGQMSHLRLDEAERLRALDRAWAATF